MRFYTGSYNEEESPAPSPTGEGIGAFSLDLEKGDVTAYGYYERRNPSYLCISSNDKYLFVAEELPEGKGAKVYSYSISLDGELSVVDSKEIEGAFACHLALCKNHLIIANYLSGDALVFAVLENGHLSSIKQKISNHGIGPNKIRQEAAHAHMIYPWKGDSFFLVDLTLDAAHSYYYKEDIQQFVKDENYSLDIDAGAGARHMVLSHDYSMAFVLGELSGEIFVFERKKGAFVKKRTLKYIMEGVDCIPSGAAIRIHPDGDFIYASDRATSMIAIYKIDKEKNDLSHVGYQETTGKSPRDFDIDPSGNWLLVANQDSNDLVVFRINRESGLLTRQSSIEVKTPVNVCFQAASVS